jgi:hypothetical protein
MPAGRVIYPPMSGGDRKHYSRELHKAEVAYEHAARDAAAAHEAADIALARAHALDCVAWSALQFIGGPEDPSPAIAAAIHGGHELLEVKCRHCNHSELVDLTELIWPREKPVHTLKGVLFCQPCRSTYGRKRRPDLLGLRRREKPQPPAPARRAR